VVVVHPVAVERRVVRVDAEGEIVSARRSPKRDGPHAIFDELVFVPRAVEHERLAFEVVLTREDVVHGPPDGKRRRRRPAGTRHLVEVVDRARFDEPRQLAALLPDDLEEPFAVRDVAAALGVTVLRAQRCAYVLRELGLIRPSGRRARAPLYARTRASSVPAAR
jgi:hypothetical protein